MMCGFTKDGYNSEKFGFVSFNTDMRNLKPELVQELSEKQASSWSVFLINRNIEDLKQSMIIHNCPVNEANIRIIVKDEIANTPTRLRNKALPVLKDLVIIGTLITLALTVFKVI